MHVYHTINQSEAIFKFTTRCLVFIILQKTRGIETLGMWNYDN